MVGVLTPKTCWALHKRQVINLRNFCIWLVDLFETYDDARSCKLLMWMLIFCLLIFISQQTATCTAGVVSTQFPVQWRKKLFHERWSGRGVKLNTLALLVPSSGQSRAIGLISTATYNFVTYTGKTSPLLTYITLHGLKYTKQTRFLNILCYYFFISAGRLSKRHYHYDLRRNAEWPCLS